MADRLSEEMEEQIKHEFHEIARFFGVQELTSIQKRAITCCLRNEDVFLSTKTGGGKSMTYLSIPVVGRLRNKNWLVIVVSPLVSIMKEQTEMLRVLGVNAAYIGERANQAPKDIFGGDMEVVFGTPEALVDDEKWRSMVQSSSHRIKVIVVDEAHTVNTW